MTPEDRREFSRLDEAVGLAARAAKVVIDGGRALKAIRDRQLYRAVSETWEGYIQRHGLTRRRADQLVAAAGVLDAVSERFEAETGTTVPDLSERALRPLVGMDADLAADAVIEAAGDPAGITPASIRKAASRRKDKGNTKAKAARPRRFKVPGAVVVVTFNRKGSASVVAALEDALRKALDDDRQADAA